MGLEKLLVYRHLTLGLRIGSVGLDFFILVKVSLVPRALPLFDISLVAGKWTFICDNRYKDLVNQRKQGNTIYLVNPKN